MTHPENNTKLSAIFHSMADCYSYLGKEDRFRAIAYENVAKMLHNMNEDISIYATNKNTLDEISGIGESIAEKIIEYLRTGKIKTYEELKNLVPVDLLELMHVNGMGPATLRILHEQLQINNQEELTEAITNNKLQQLKGFGLKRISNISKALKLGKQKRFLLKEAELHAQKMLTEIKKIPGVHKAELAGSLRRKNETIGDIDIVLTANEGDWQKIVKKIIHLPQVERVLVAGRTKASVVLRELPIQADIRIVHDNEFGSALLYFTGSKEHNIKLRTLAKERGYKINEYGIFNKNGKRLAGETEEEMYHFLKLNYIPPEKRQGNRELSTTG